jgi:hypothetical protein
MTARNTEWRRKRYAEDPEYRTRIRAANRAYYAAHKAGINERRRQRWRTDPEFRERGLARARERDARIDKLKQIYGITSDDYDAILARQNGACAICKTTIATLCVDHCHATGAVRGLLCRKCNTGLGCYDDNPRRILTAIAYLRAIRGKQPV